jgi:hypothetical protein
MADIDPENTFDNDRLEYGYRLSEDEIKNRGYRDLPVRIAAGILLFIMLFGIFQIWRMPFALINKIGFSALPTFLVVYLVRFLLTPPPDPVLEENRLVIDGEGITVNNNYARWDSIDIAELKDRRDGKYLQISVSNMREGYTAPARETLFVWQVERFGDIDEIISQINLRLKEPVVVS